MSARTFEPDTRPRQDKPRRRWWAYFGVNSLALSILIHVLFGVVATYLIVEHLTAKKHINFQASEPPAPQQVEHKVQLAKRNNQESAPPDLKRIVTTDVSSITLPEPPDIPTPDVTTPSPMAGIDGTLGLGDGMGGGGGGGGGGSPLFGAPDGVGLEGHFYDLKQTSDRRATNIKYKDYYADLTKFVTSGWNDALFSRNFESKTALYANSIAISMRLSEEAPKAFQVGDVVKPAFWVVRYHGKVAAPETGDYQFVGFADNVLVVRIGKEVVLDAGWNLILPKQRDLHQELPSTWLGKKTPPIQNALAKTEPHFRRNALKKGKIFHMNAAEPVEMDVLIGDDGGNCGFYLLIMNTGHTYEKLPDGTPKAPFFQLGDGSPPSFSQGEACPPNSTSPEPWECSEK